MGVFNDFVIVVVVGWLLCPQVRAYLSTYLPPVVTYEVVASLDVARVFPMHGSAGSVAGCRVTSGRFFVS